MLSYLHAFHAGNGADVHKHGALARLIAHLTAKPRPLTYMETHAGRGFYDLSGPEAQKTGEAVDGIGRIVDLAADDPYLKAVAAARTKAGPSAYPGSPWIARHLLRDGDTIHLMERHPAEAPALKKAMRGSGAHIHHRDGYEGVLAISPPRARRGLVLVDPSFEVKTEYAGVARFVPALLKKWPEAAVLVWYPILAEGRHRDMLASLEAAGLADTDVDEIRFPDAQRTGGLLGSGLFLAGRPFGYALRRGPHG